MLPYASKYRFLLNICRYSCVSGRPFLPRSRRTLSTTAASCIAHASWPGAIHRLCPFALWTAINGLQIGRTSPRRLLRALRRHRRSEEHTSELQSPYDLVCRLLLEKKNEKELTHDVFDLSCEIYR